MLNGASNTASLLPRSLLAIASLCLVMKPGKSHLQWPNRTSDHVRQRSDNIKSRPAMPSNGPSPGPAASVSKQQGNGDRTQRSRRPQRKRVTVIGSSLVRGLGPLVNCEQFEAVSYTHPGAMAELLSSRVTGMTKGSNSDVIVVAGGTNNISERCSSQHIQAIQKSVDSLAEINPRSEIIISKIPHRFDNAKLNLKVDNVNGYIRRISIATADTIP